MTASFIRTLPRLALPALLLLPGCAAKKDGCEPMIGEWQSMQGVTLVISRPDGAYQLVIRSPGQENGFPLACKEGVLTTLGIPNPIQYVRETDSIVTNGRAFGRTK